MKSTFTSFLSALHRSTDRRISRVRKRVRRSLLKIRSLPAIRAKWKRDSRLLPLTEELWPLYAETHLLSQKALGVLPNLLDPQGINDRVHWLKLFDQDLRIPTLQDKLGGKAYVTELLGQDHVVPVQWVGENPRDLAHLDLEPPYVVKTNHDSGSVFFVTDRSTPNQERMIRKLEKSLSRHYGFGTAEWSYALIEPRVFVEAFIEPDPGHTRLADWRFHCVNGQVKWLQYLCNIDGVRMESLVSREGEVLPFNLVVSAKPGAPFERPANWEQILTLVETVAEGWKYLRVDTYVAGNRVYFGELTFYPVGGTYPNEGQLKLGPLVDFDTTTTKEPVIVREVHRRGIPISPWSVSGR